MSTSVDEIFDASECDRSEPLLDKLYTNTGEGYDVNKDQGAVDYGDDESIENGEMDEDDYTSNEGSKVEVNMDQGEW